MTHTRINEKTPTGGDYSEILYLDDAGNLVDETVATKCVIRECKNDGTLVNETFGVCDAKPQKPILLNSYKEQFTARFGGRLFYAMPDIGYVYEYRGRCYLLKGSGPDPEAVMKASLEQGKNLLIKTFPVVDLYPDPKAVY